MQVWYLFSCTLTHHAQGKRTPFTGRETLHSKASSRVPGGLPVLRHLVPERQAGKWHRRHGDPVLPHWGWRSCFHLPKAAPHSLFPNITPVVTTLLGTWSTLTTLVDGPILSERVSTPTAACHPGMWGRQYCAHWEKRKQPTTHTHTPLEHSANTQRIQLWAVGWRSWRGFYTCVCVVAGVVESGWAAAGPHPGESPSARAPMRIPRAVCDATSQLHLCVLLTQWSDTCCDRPASRSLICGSKAAPTWSVPSLSTWAAVPPWGRVPWEGQRPHGEPDPSPAPRMPHSSRRDKSCLFVTLVGGTTKVTRTSQFSQGHSRGWWVKRC